MRGEDEQGSGQRTGRELVLPSRGAPGFFSFIDPALATLPAAVWAYVDGMYIDRD